MHACSADSVPTSSQYTSSTEVLKHVSELHARRGIPAHSRAPHQIRAAARSLQLVHKLAAWSLAVSVDRDDPCLHRGQPGREGAGRVLCEDAHEALDGAEYGPVDHDGPLLGVLPIHVLHLKALWEVEVQLDGGALPLAPDGVLQCTAITVQRLHESFHLHSPQEPPSLPSHSRAGCCWSLSLPWCVACKESLLLKGGQDTKTLC